MEHITEEEILLLNNGSVTFEQARARFNVDMFTFKERLKQLNIFVWKEVDGSLVRIHGGDYELKILFRDLGKSGMCFIVKGTKSFEDIIRMLEKQLNLSPGCYELSYKHLMRSVGKVCVKTDRDWHNAVRLSELRGYFVLLDLEVFPSTQTADVDACDEDAFDEDYTDDDFYMEQFDDDNYVEPVFVEDPFDEDACDDVSWDSMEHITKESILSLNNRSVSFEQARALLNVDLPTFKARLEQLNIFVWKEVHGESVRIHGGDYKITIILMGRGLEFKVRGTDTYEDVINKLEKTYNLSRGCYKLSYKDPDRSVGKVWVKTDRDWHNAVLISRRRGYYVLLYLKKFESSWTADEDACDELMMRD